MRRSIFMILAAVMAACSSDATTNNATDAGSDAAADPVSVLATFDMTKGELPEGLWEVGPAAEGFIGKGGTPITAWAPAAAPVTIAGGKATSFGSLGAKQAQSTYTLGVITDAPGNVYFAVAAAAAPPNDPGPGIYKLPAGGGTATAFSLGSAATPPMYFANGLDVIGDKLFVADSEGVVYAIDSGGKATAWSQDALLAPDAAACGGKVTLPIGANGIVHDANAVYVTNTNHGRLVRIPIQGDGSAGTASVVIEDCNELVGADGLLIDPKDGSFIVALNALDRIVRVAKDGSAVSVIASGKPLANPASLVLDTSGTQRRLLVSNPAFFKQPGETPPSLVQIVLPP